MPPLHEKAIHSLSFSPNGKLVVTASEDGSARLWNVAAAQPRGPALPHRSNDPPLFSFDGNLLLTMREPQVPQVWSTDTGEPHGPTWRPQSTIIGAAFVDNSRHVLVRDELKRAAWVELSTGKPEKQPFDLADERTVIRADGKLLATIHGSRVQITRDGQAIGPPLEHPSNVTAFTFSPDGLACATGTEDGTAYLWDCVRCKAAGKPLEHPGPVRGVTFSAKGRAFLAWSGSNHVRLWSTATGKPLLPPLMHPAEVGAAVFTPDGQAIAVASGRVVYLWDVATGKRLGPQLHHPDRVTHVVPSPDGSRLATACADRSVRFWDLVMPATGSVAENRAWVEALTGRELSDTGTIHEIDPATLQDLRRDLGMRGDEPFPRPTLRVLSPR
jgi:WD40 repeat protein